LLPIFLKHAIDWYSGSRQFIEKRTVYLVEWLGNSWTDPAECLIGWPVQPRERGLDHATPQTFPTSVSDADGTAICCCKNEW
jgi:hypothetical protein